MSQPQRIPWGDFPKITSHAATSDVRFDRSYEPAIHGDLKEALSLVSRHFQPDNCPAAKGVDFIAAPTRIAPDGSISAIPAALGLSLARDLDAKFVPDIMQANKFEHTTTSEPRSLTFQPVYDGHVPQGRWATIHDHMHLGSSVANLRGYIHSQGSEVAASTTLSSALFTSNLVPDQSVISAIKTRFGNELDPILQERLGFDSATLTSREAYFVNGLQSLAQLRSLQNPQHFNRGHSQ